MFGMTGFVLLSQNVEEEYLENEYDYTERSATVYLYSRTVNGLESINESTSNNGAGHHWALVVHFEDDSYRMLEGNRNKDGYLHAHYSKHDGSGLSLLKELGGVVTSPWKLREAAKGNKLNGTRYAPINNNCQDWVIAAAKNISYSIGKEAARTPRLFRLF